MVGLFSLCSYLILKYRGEMHKKHLLIFLFVFIYIGRAETTIRSDSNINVIQDKNQTQKNSVLLQQQKNLFFIDMVISYGGFVGLHYERALTKTLSAEFGIAPVNIFFKYRGAIIPVGVNIFLPFGDKHRIGLTLKGLFYSGSDPTSDENESKTLASKISKKEMGLPLYGIYYQFKNDYSIVYRLGVGAYVTIPVIELKVGYNF